VFLNSVQICIRTLLHRAWETAVNNRTVFCEIRASLAMPVAMRT